MASSAAAFVAVCSSESSSPSPASLIFARSASSAAFSSTIFFLGAELTSLYGMPRRIWSMGFLSMASSSSPGKGSRGSHALTTIGESSSLTAMVGGRVLEWLTPKMEHGHTRQTWNTAIALQLSSSPVSESKKPGEGFERAVYARASVRANVEGISRILRVKVHLFLLADPQRRSSHGGHPRPRRRVTSIDPKRCSRERRSAPPWWRCSSPPRSSRVSSPTTPRPPRISLCTR